MSTSPSKPTDLKELGPYPDVDLSDYTDLYAELADQATQKAKSTLAHLRQIQTQKSNPADQNT